MAAAVAGLSLRPATSSVEFNPRPSARPVSKTPQKGSAHSVGRASVNSQDAVLVANPKLSVIEVEALLRDKVKSKYRDLQQGFLNYDMNNTTTVTRGEFRRVIETFAFPLTTDQFTAVVNKVQTQPNGTVNYRDFLNKFCDGKASSRPATQEKWQSATHRYNMQSPVDMNTDQLERQVRDKVSDNLRNVIKSLRLYDYNRDGHVQRHELRKVLETYCFKMTDQQFDKLYQRYDFHHRGVINYKEFLTRLGLNVEKALQPPSDSTAQGALNWQQQQSRGRLSTSGSQGREDNALAGMNIFQIEMLFRQKMRDNYVTLKKMFLAFDKHLDGFIQLDDLKRILNQFTIPLTDQLFNQLMDRFQFKASGKISWEYFLEKFQDPQSHGNGQTVTIKPGHKYFPNRGTQETMNMREIVRLLDHHVKNAYSSFKNAFLEIDKTRKGYISRKEMKKILNSFKFRLTEGQFSEIMKICDPDNTNQITYHHFLHLFEPKESLQEGHKWLNSCHRVNETVPAVLAWETVEGVLKDRMQLHWKEVSDEVASADPKRSGKLTPKQLKKIVEKHSIPISDEHFQKMLEKIEDKDGEKVNYVEFFTNLNVVVVAGDVEGLSSQIHDGSNETEKQRMDTQLIKQTEVEISAQMRTDVMSVDEIIVRIRDRVQQHNTAFRNAFKGYDKRQRGKISKKDFRNVIESFGFYMTDAHFKELCSRLQFYNGFMTYEDFIINFEDPRHAGAPEALIKVNNHHVNKIRGDEYGLSALEVESKLRNKLRENFEGLRGAFYKFDDDHNGLLTKKNFRRMLDAFMCPMCDDEFDKLCQRLGVDKKSKIGYTDFLDKFEVRDTEEGHKWLNSDHKFNETLPMKLMSADQVHLVLAEKAHQQFKDLAKAFRTMDSSSNGVLTKNDLRETLYKFMIPISKPEFARLWQKYDQGGKGHVSHTDFLRHLTGEQFAPSDQGGTSQDIIGNSYKKLDEHHQEQLEKHEMITNNQANKTSAMNMDKIIQELKDKLRSSFDDFQSAFKKYDKKQKGYLNTGDIQRMLVDFHFFLDDDQYYDFLQRIGISSKNNKMPYEDFLKAFEEGRKDAYASKPKDAYVPNRMYDHLSNEAATEKMKEKMADQMEVIMGALSAFDRGGSHKIGATEFRRVLDNFCFMLSDKQFKHFMSQMGMDKTVDLSQLAEQFNNNVEQDPHKWIYNLDQRLYDDNPPNPITMDDVHETLRELVTARFSDISRAFADLDYARIGVCAKDDFRAVLNRHTIRLSDEQFEKLWLVLSVNEFGNIDYKDFLRRYTNDARGTTPMPPPTPMGGRRPHTSDSFRESLHTSRSGRLARPFTPLVNAESVEQKLQSKISKHWKDIQRQCKQCDMDNTGMINQEDIRGILARYHLDLTPDEVLKLLLKYDLRNNNRFCYAEFLKHFVLHMKQDNSGLLTRRNTQSRNSLRTPAQSTELTDAMNRLQMCVQDGWKDMRRDFRYLDQSGVGTISPNDFREVLRRNNANLSEDEFYHIMSYYSSAANGNVDYNKFLKAFLKS